MQIQVLSEEYWTCGTYGTMGQGENGTCGTYGTCGTCVMGQWDKIRTILFPFHQTGNLK